MSKTQLKKNRKNRRRELLQLAKLHRKKAEAEEAIARMYEAMADKLRNP